jgi:hypothetical protein
MLRGGLRTTGHDYFRRLIDGETAGDGRRDGEADGDTDGDGDGDGDRDGVGETDGIGDGNGSGDGEGDGDGGTGRCAKATPATVVRTAADDHGPGHESILGRSCGVPGGPTLEFRDARARDSQLPPADAPRGGAEPRRQGVVPWRGARACSRPDREVPNVLDPLRARARAHRDGGRRSAHRDDGRAPGRHRLAPGPRRNRRAPARGRARPLRVAHAPRHGDGGRRGRPRGPRLRGGGGAARPQRDLRGRPPDGAARRARPSASSATPPRTSERAGSCRH